MTRLAALRREYHCQVGEQIVRFAKNDRYTFPNYADGSSRTSVEIANRTSETLSFSRTAEKVDGQTAGSIFQNLTCTYLQEAFGALYHLRPGKWEYLAAQTEISNFVQYEHLNTLVSVVKTDHNLAAALGHGYIVTPDIVVARHPATDDEFNEHGQLIKPDGPIANLTQFRASNQTNRRLFLHASISCKWTIRRDRSQNTRTEALNLIRNRKGPLPHIVAVTAEPLPMRIASLALGTGDLDCVYHFALPELREGCAAIDRGDDQLEMLNTMIQGHRLRDISDLPFDLAV